jgi:hypothetical protein
MSAAHEPASSTAAASREYLMCGLGLSKGRIAASLPGDATSFSNDNTFWAALVMRSWVGCAILLGEVAGSTSLNNRMLFEPLLSWHS